MQDAGHPADEAFGDALASRRGAGHPDPSCAHSKWTFRLGMGVVVRRLSARSQHTGQRGAVSLSTGRLMEQFRTYTHQGRPFPKCAIETRQARYLDLQASSQYQAWELCPSASESKGRPIGFSQHSKVASTVELQHLRFDRRPSKSLAPHLVWEGPDRSPPLPLSGRRRRPRGRKVPTGETGTASLRCFQSVAAASPCLRVQHCKRVLRLTSLPSATVEA